MIDLFDILIAAVLENVALIVKGHVQAQSSFPFREKSPPEAPLYLSLNVPRLNSDHISVASGTGHNGNLKLHVSTSYVPLRSESNRSKAGIYKQFPEQHLPHLPVRCPIYASIYTQY